MTVFCMLENMDPGKTCIFVKHEPDRNSTINCNLVVLSAIGENQQPETLRFNQNFETPSIKFFSFFRANILELLRHFRSIYNFNKMVENS